MRVSDILRGKSREAVGVPGSASVRDAIAQFARHGIGFLLVTDDRDTLEGVVSERDVVRILDRRGEAAFDLPVSDIMNKPVVTCGPEEDSHNALVLMGKHMVRHIPVVENERPVGVISARDILRTLSETGTAEERAALWAKIAWL